MARGRFISNYVIEDREFNELSSDTCRLAYIFLITIADREGRITGDLDYLTSKLFPRRREITTEIVEGYIREWANADFIVWYENESGHKAIQLINFDKHQKGLRKDREPVSEFDDPETCKIILGELPLKNKELKEESLINNVNVNVKRDKNLADNPALIRQNDGNNPDNGLFEACQRIYETKNGRLVTDGKGFALMINNFKKHGVTSDDYAAAIDAMNADPKYKGTKPTSYEKWAIGYTEERHNTKNNSKQIITKSGPNGEIYKFES